MQWITAFAMVALFHLGFVSPTLAGTEPDAASALWRRTPFVIGAPGRLDGESDRRHPRRYARADSAVGAYADVEEVQDATWLRHEIEHYARRAVACAGVGDSWCRREVRRLPAGRVIFLSAGVHAELVWLSRRNLAIRLGWQRVVVTPTGSMTLDAPPAAFATALLGEFPSRLEAFEFDARREAGWPAQETDRLLYYADQVIAGLSAVGAEAYRRHAAHFVEDNLAQVSALGVLDAPDDAPRTDAGGGEEAGGALPPPIARRLAAIRGSRGGAAAPWCAAQMSSPAAVHPSEW